MPLSKRIDERVIEQMRRDNPDYAAYTDEQIKTMPSFALIRLGTSLHDLRDAIGHELLRLLPKRWR